MKAPFTIALLVCIVLPSAASAAEAEKSTLLAHYSVVGTNPDGSRYSGLADIKMVSDTSFNIVWHIASGTQKGFGMHMNNAVSATYMLNGEPGLIIYTAQGNGSFTGIWAIEGKSGSGTETLTPRH